MARLKGLIKLEGTLDDLTFYKTQDGNLVRMKGGVSGERIANDPAFERTRENGAEFGASASAGRLLRTTLRTLMMNSADNRVTSRLTQVMTQIKNYDTTSARGERSVAVGLTEPAAKQMLKGFDFNAKATLSSVLFSTYAVTQATGAIALERFVPALNVAFPSGATHMSLTSAYAVVDFDAGTSAIEYSPVTNLPIDMTSTDVTLTPAGVPAGTGTKFYLLMIEFFQEVNGVQYTLKNGAYNVLTIVDVG